LAGDDTSLVHRTQYSRTESYADLAHMPAGKYIVVPSTVQPGMRQTFILRMYAQSPISIHPIETGSDWKCVLAKGEWAPATDGGLGSTRNPLFILNIREATDVFVSLQVTDKEAPLQVQIYNNNSNAKSTAVDAASDGRITRPPHLKSSLMRHLEACVSGKLGAGSWLVIPCSPERVSGRSFTLKIYSGQSVDLVTVV
jgi:hypothetical protein